MKEKGADYDATVIRAGIAGMTAAVTARGLGADGKTYKNPMGYD